MSGVIAALLAALGVVGKLAPPPFDSLAQLIVTLVGRLDLPAGDPRAEAIAKVLAEALDDMKAALDIPDASARDAARLAIENRVLRAWVELTPGGGI